MQFPSDREANRFLLAKVLSQAEFDGVTLSPLEEHALIWPDCDHTIGEDDDLEEQLFKETTPEEFEEKIANLVWRAYQRDRSADPSSTPSYRAAYRQLRTSEYLLAGMADAVAAGGSWANALRCGVLYGLALAALIFLALRLPTRSYPHDPTGSVRMAASIAGIIFVLVFGAYVSLTIAGLPVTRWGDVKGSRRQIYVPLAVFLSIGVAIAAGLTMALY